MLDALMTPQELSDLLRVPVGTLYAWRYRQEGPPAHRVGRHLRYDRSQVEAWLAKQRDTVRAAG